MASPGTIKSSLRSSVSSPKRAVVLIAASTQSAPSCFDPYAEKDAHRIAALLSCYGYHARLIRGPDATRRSFLEALRGSSHGDATASPTGDHGAPLLVVAIAQGRTDDTGTPCLLLEDAVLRDPTTWLPLPRLAQSLRRGGDRSVCFAIPFPMQPHALQAARAAARLTPPNPPRGEPYGTLHVITGLAAHAVATPAWASAAKLPFLLLMSLLQAEGSAPPSPESSPSLSLSAVVAGLGGVWQAPDAPLASGVMRERFSGRADGRRGVWFGGTDGGGSGDAAAPSPSGSGSPSGSASASLLLHYAVALPSTVGLSPGQGEVVASLASQTTHTAHLASLRSQCAARLRDASSAQPLPPHANRSQHLLAAPIVAGRPEKPFHWGLVLKKPGATTVLITLLRHHGPSSKGGLELIRVWESPGSAGETICLWFASKRGVFDSVLGLPSPPAQQGGDGGGAGGSLRRVSEERLGDPADAAAAAREAQRWVVCPFLVRAAKVGVPDVSTLYSLERSFRGAFPPPIPSESGEIPVDPIALLASRADIPPIMQKNPPIDHVSESRSLVRSFGSSPPGRSSPYFGSDMLPLGKTASALSNPDAFGGSVSGGMSVSPLPRSPIGDASKLGSGFLIHCLQGTGSEKLGHMLESAQTVSSDAGSIDANLESILRGDDLFSSSATVVRDVTQAVELEGRKGGLRQQQQRRNRISLDNTTTTTTGGDSDGSTVDSSEGHRGDYSGDEDASGEEEVSGSGSSDDDDEDDNDDSHGARALQNELQKLRGSSSFLFHCASSENVLQGLLRRQSGDLIPNDGKGTTTGPAIQGRGSLGNASAAEGGDAGGSGDGPFTARLAMPQYGERNPGLEFLKFGDKITLLSREMEGLLSIRWHGDGCDPTLQTSFGQSRTPKHFENCVFSVERTSEATLHPGGDAPPGSSSRTHSASGTVHVAFGNAVRLRHSASGRYISSVPVLASPTATEQDAEELLMDYDAAAGGFVCYGVRLLRDTDLAPANLEENCLTFRFATSSKLRTDGERVRIGDGCHVISHVGNCLLSVGMGRHMPASGRAAEAAEASAKTLPCTADAPTQKKPGPSVYLIPIKSHTDAQGAEGAEGRGMDTFANTRWAVAPYFVRKSDDPELTPPAPAAAAHQGEQQKAQGLDGVPAFQSHERQRYLETGRPVLLFHRELEGFLTARGELTRADRPWKDGSFLERLPDRAADQVNWSFWGDGEHGQRFQLYFDTSGSASGRDSGNWYPMRDFSHSSNAMWMLEELDPSRGGYLQWVAFRKAYRIKHIASGGYLVAAEEGGGESSHAQKGHASHHHNLGPRNSQQGPDLGARRDSTCGSAKATLSITLNPDRLDSIVLLHPVNSVAGTAEDKGLHTSSYCRIQFALSQLWLHFAQEDGAGGGGGGGSGTPARRSPPPNASATDSSSGEDSFPIGSPRQLGGGAGGSFASVTDALRNSRSFDRPPGPGRNSSSRQLVRHSSGAGKSFLRRNHVPYRLNRTASLRDLALSGSGEALMRQSSDHDLRRRGSGGGRPGRQGGGAADADAAKGGSGGGGQQGGGAAVKTQWEPRLCATPQYEGVFAIRFAASDEYESLLTLAALKRGLKDSVAYWLATLQARAHTEEEANEQSKKLLEQKAKAVPNSEHIQSIHDYVSGTSHDANLDNVMETVKLFVKFCFHDGGSRPSSQAPNSARQAREAAAQHSPRTPGSPRKFEGDDANKQGFDPYGNHGSVKLERQTMLFSQEVHMLILKVVQVPLAYREVIQQRLQLQTQQGVQIREAKYAVSSGGSQSASPASSPSSSRRQSPPGKTLLNQSTLQQLSPLEMFEEKYAPIFRLCFHLLKQMVRKSQLLSGYLEPFIPFIESMLEHNYHANKTLCEVYSGNTRLLQTLTKEQLKSYVFPTPHLEILSASCVTEDPNTSELIGIPRNQEIILGILERSDVGIIFPTRGHKGAIWVQPLLGWKHSVARDGKAPLLLAQAMNDAYEEIPMAETDKVPSPQHRQPHHHRTASGDAGSLFPRIVPHNALRRDSLPSLCSGDLLEVTAKVDIAHGSSAVLPQEGEMWSSDNDENEPAYYALPLVPPSRGNSAAGSVGVFKKLRKRSSFTGLSSRSTGDKSLESFEDDDDDEPYLDEDINFTPGASRPPGAFPPPPARQQRRGLARTLGRQDSRQSIGSEASSTFFTHGMTPSGRGGAASAKKPNLLGWEGSQGSLGRPPNGAHSKSNQMKKDRGWVTIYDFVHLYSDVEPEIIAHFVATLTLLGNLCVGADYDMRKRVSKNAPFKEALIGLRMDFTSAHCDSIRTAYARIAKYLYVSCGVINVNTFVEHPAENSTSLTSASRRDSTTPFEGGLGVPAASGAVQYTRLSSCMSTLSSALRVDLPHPGGSDSEGVGGGSMQRHRQASVLLVRDINRSGRQKEVLLKGVILHFLSSNTQLITECLRRNELIVSVLKLMRGMLLASHKQNHRLLHTREHKELINVVVSILDPSTDVLGMLSAANPPYSSMPERAAATTPATAPGLLRRTHRSNSAFRGLLSSTHTSGMAATAKQSFSLGRKRRGSVTGAAGQSIFTASDLTQMVVETKVEACKVLMTLMEIDRERFLHAMSSVAREVSRKRESRQSIGLGSPAPEDSLRFSQIDLSFGAGVSFASQSAASVLTDTAADLHTSQNIDLQASGADLSVNGHVAGSPRQGGSRAAQSHRPSHPTLFCGGSDEPNQVPPEMLLQRILLDVTLYEDNTVLYSTAVEALFRLMEEADASSEEGFEAGKKTPRGVGGSAGRGSGGGGTGVDLAHLTDAAIEKMADFVSDHLILKPIGPKADKYVYLKSLLRHLRSSPEGDDLGVAILRTFTKVLKGSTCSATERTRKASQSLLNSLGLTTLIPPMLESHHPSVVRSALECGVALLDGGNRRVQLTLYSHFLKRQEETLFKSLADRIRNCILLIETVESDPYLMDYSEYVETRRGDDALPHQPLGAAASQMDLDGTLSNTFNGTFTKLSPSFPAEVKVALSMPPAAKSALNTKAWRGGIGAGASESSATLPAFEPVSTQPLEEHLPSKSDALPSKGRPQAPGSPAPLDAGVLQAEGAGPAAPPRRSNRGSPAADAPKGKRSVFEGKAPPDHQGLRTSLSQKREKRAGAPQHLSPKPPSGRNTRLARFASPLKPPTDSTDSQGSSTGEEREDEQQQQQREAVAASTSGKGSLSGFLDSLTSSPRGAEKGGSGKRFFGFLVDAKDVSSEHDSSEAAGSPAGPAASPRQRQGRDGSDGDGGPSPSGANRDFDDLDTDSEESDALGQYADSRALQWYRGTHLFHAEAVMRYLQLLCIGTCAEMQHYLREQHDNVNSFNLVSESLRLLEQILQVEIIDGFIGGTVLQCFNTLSEFCHGPIPENQFSLVENGMCLAVNAVFLNAQQGGVDLALLQRQKPELIEQIRSAAISAMLALLEGVTGKALPSIMLGVEGLDLEALRDTLDNVWQVKEDEDVPTEGAPVNSSGKADYALELGFNIFILLRTLEGYYPLELRGLLDSLMSTACGRYFYERTGRIEISRGARLERVYFRIPEVCIAQGLSERSKYDILWTVRRNTDTERVTDFIEKGDLLIYEIDYNNRWFSDHVASRIQTSADPGDSGDGASPPWGVIAAFHEACAFWSDPDAVSRRRYRKMCRRYGPAMEMYTVAVAVVTNLLVLMNDAFMHPGEGEGSEQEGMVTEALLSAALSVLSVAQFVLLFVACSSFVVTEAPTIAYRRFRAREREKLLQLQTTGVYGVTQSGHPSLALHPTGQEYSHTAADAVRGGGPTSPAGASATRSLATEEEATDFDDGSSAMSSSAFSPQSMSSSAAVGLAGMGLLAGRRRTTFGAKRSAAHLTSRLGEPRPPQAAVDSSDDESPRNAIRTAGHGGRSRGDAEASSSDDSHIATPVHIQSHTLYSSREAFPVALDSVVLPTRPSRWARVAAVFTALRAAVVWMCSVVWALLRLLWRLVAHPRSVASDCLRFCGALRGRLAALSEFTKGAEDPASSHSAAVAQACLSTFSFHYFVVMLVFAVLGIVGHPLFLSVHLMSIARSSHVLHNVIRAVTQNGRALLLTCVLGVVVVYLFSVAAYILFQDMIVTNNGERVCGTLLRCFAYALTHGVRSDGGLGDHMLDPSPSSSSYTYQMAFELLFFVLVIVILLNIIFGIIIDTFAELRARRQAIEEDIRNKCFICGLSASEFDRYADGFKHHIRQDHNMWLYIFFIHHLRLKEGSRLTGQELFVTNQLYAMDFSFFPLSQALALERKEAKEADAVDQSQNKDLMRMISDIDGRISEDMAVTMKETSEIRNQLSDLSRIVKGISRSTRGIRSPRARSNHQNVPGVASFVLGSGRM